MPELVAIGDSFTQGFKSLAISECHLSYPALIARAMKLPVFRSPDFSSVGGLPLNLETLIRKCGKKFGIWDFLSLATGIGPIGQWNQQNRHYWESLPARSETVSITPPIQHNLAIWGVGVSDAYQFMTSQYSNNILETKPSQSSDFSQHFEPSYAWYRTATRTLNPKQSAQLNTMTQLDLARELSKTEGRIEHLIFCLGSNDILGAVLGVGQTPVYSQPADLNKPPEERKLTVWRPEEFEVMYKKVFEVLKTVDFNALYVGNVPRLSILPYLRGQTLSGPNVPDSNGYYEYYYACYVHDDAFQANPKGYPAFTKAQMQTLDNTVSQYNQIIQSVVNDFSNAGHSCQLVDFHGLLDSLAYRRNNTVQYYDFPPNLVSALSSIPNTQNRFKPDSRHPGQQIPILDSRFYTFDPTSNVPEKRYEGGLFSLDGIHPSTTFAGMIAAWFLEKMGKSDLATLDWWQSIVRDDSLLMDPPAALENLMDTLGDFQRHQFFKLAQELFQ